MTGLVFFRPDRRHGRPTPGAAVRPLSSSLVLTLRGALAMRFRRVLVRGLRVAMRLGGMLMGGGMVAFAMMLGGSTVGFCRGFVRFSRFRVTCLCHYVAPFVAGVWLPGK